MFPQIEPQPQQDEEQSLLSSSPSSLQSSSKKFPAIAFSEMFGDSLPKMTLDVEKNVAHQSPELNSPAYALVQALQHHTRESSYIDAILLNPDSLNYAYNPLGTTALMRASELESKHLEKLLLAGSYVNAVDRLGRSALYYAAKTGADDAINYLVAYGATPNIRDVKSGELAIHVSCRHGKDSTVRFLGQSCGVAWYGPESMRISDKYTPLHECCRWGHAGCARVLLGLAEEVMDNNEKDDHGSLNSANGQEAGSGTAGGLGGPHNFNGDLNEFRSTGGSDRQGLSPLLVQVVNDETCGSAPISIAAQHGHLQVLWVLIQSGAVQKSCSEWFPKLDSKLHKHLNSWVDGVLDDPRLTISNNPESTSNRILHELRERLSAPLNEVDEDDVIDDGNADY